MSRKCAVIFCCYNRMNKTKNCILSLKEQLIALSDSYDISSRFYVYDDGSIDGTADMLDSLLTDNDVIIRGDGNTFWCRSMYYAMKRARKDNPDIYLLVNDDVTFYEDALANMLKDFDSCQGQAAVVGSTEYEGILTYGGLDSSQKLIQPDETKLLTCFFANFNCFMVGKDVVNKYGIIDSHYGHSFGDYDYSHRLVKKGVFVYVCKAVVGQCENDHGRPKYTRSDVPKKDRIKDLKSPKGLDIHSLLRFTIKNQGVGEFFNIIRYYRNVRKAIRKGEDC